MSDGPSYPRDPIGPRPDPKAVLEAMLFASPEPLSEHVLRTRLGDLGDAATLLFELQRDYASRGVRLEVAQGHWSFRTAAELAPFLSHTVRPTRRPSKAALETLAVIAYRQPVTRAEIEAIRGVTIARGTFDVLVDAGWIRPNGRSDKPGRPVVWTTTEAFLDHFGLGSIADLPRIDELAGIGLLDQTLASGG